MMDNFYISQSWEEIRNGILGRDNYTCQVCGFVGHVPPKSRDRGDRSMVVHHITERKNGGDDSPNNLQTVCAPCHVQIHKRKRR